MFDVYQKGEGGKWAFRVLEKDGTEVGQSLHDYDTPEAAQAAAAERKMQHRTDFRSRKEDGKFGWQAFDTEGNLVAENTVWCDNMPDALQNANKNGFVINVGIDGGNNVSNAPVAASLATNDE